MMTLKQIESRTKFYKDGEASRVDVFEISHYTVAIYTTMVNMKETYKNITVTADSNELYFPDINYDNHYFEKDQKPEFKIQTTAYGALEAEAIKKVIAGYEEALEVVKVLTEKFC